jgi:cytidine deaminase
MRDVKYGSLELVQRQLLDEAAKAMERAYNPYSHYYVGAALLSQDGRIITGTNVENVSYGMTICAEQTAIVRANAMGIRNFDKLALIGRGENFDTTKVSGPCGRCRQVLYEFAQVSEVDLELILSTTTKYKIVIATIEELLPLAFGPEDLGIDLGKYR